MKIDVVKLLVDIDCILDTYASKIMQNDEDAMGRLLEAGYHDRLTNLLYLTDTTIPKKIFNRWMARKNGTILKGALGTTYAANLRARVKHDLQLPEDHPEYCDYEITVNLHEYTLTDEEDAKLLELLTEMFTGATVTLVNWPTSKLSPRYIKENFNSVTLYDFNQWWTTHGAMLGSCPIPEVNMIVPVNMINIEGVRDGAILTTITYMEMSFSKHLLIEAHPLGFFSFVRVE